MGPKSPEKTDVLNRDRGADKHRATLVMIKGNNPGAEFTLEKKNVLGREADISLADTAASREHAEVFLDGDTWKLSDLGSTNGTELNGKTVSTSLLKHGDKITIGRTVLQFIVDAKDPETGEIYHLDLDDA